VGRRYDQALGLEDAECFADRRPADSKVARKPFFGQLLSRVERSVENGTPNHIRGGVACAAIERGSLITPHDSGHGRDDIDEPYEDRPPRSQEATCRGVNLLLVARPFSRAVEAVHPEPWPRPRRRGAGSKLAADRSDALRVLPVEVETRRPNGQPRDCASPERGCVCGGPRR